MDEVKFVPKTELIDRRVYRLQSRNLLVGVWVAERDGFIGVREKFGDEYLFTEYHLEGNGATGTANGIEDLRFNIPKDVELRERKPTLDNRTGRLVGFTEPIAKGGRGWIFLDTGEASTSIAPVSYPNQELFDILYPYHEKFTAALIIEQAAWRKGLETD
jgi:hypothetical protein